MTSMAKMASRAVDPPQAGLDHQAAHSAREGSLGADFLASRLVRASHSRRADQARARVLPPRAAGSIPQILMTSSGEHIFNSFFVLNMVAECIVCVF